MELISGTGSIDVWTVAPERISKSENRPTSDTKHRKIFSVVSLYFFGYTSTISRFGEHFRGGQYSLLSFLFAVLLLTVPSPVPSHL